MLYARLLNHPMHIYSWAVTMQLTKPRTTITSLGWLIMLRRTMDFKWPNNFLLQKSTAKVLFFFQLHCGFWFLLSQFIRLVNFKVSFIRSLGCRRRGWKNWRRKCSIARLWNEHSLWPLLLPQAAPFYCHQLLPWSAPSSWQARVSLFPTWDFLCIPSP